MSRPTRGRSADPGFQSSPVIGMPLDQRGRAPRARHNF
jgi:hypothetical protein